MTEHRKSQPGEKTTPEPLSPELALVDPQLADLARERLRVARDSAAFGRRAASASRKRPAEDRADARSASDEYAERRPGERLAVGRAAARSQDDRSGTASTVPESELEFSASPPDDAEGGPSSGRTRPRRRRVFTAALGVLAVGAAAFPIVAHEVTDVGGGVIGTTPTRSESLPAKRTGDARENHRTSEPPRAGTGTAVPHSTKPAVQPKKGSQSHSTKPAVQPKKGLQPGRPSKFPTRVFVWPAVSRATFYKVEFFRRGRKIFEASPTVARIELPLRWAFRGRHFRLTPATYKWEVRAAFGPRSHPRYGKLITQSKWTAQ
jgi:hypothetical protein